MLHAVQARLREENVTTADPVTSPWVRDDELVPISHVEWIAKNTFLVTVPSYRRKLSCELTAVDVPRMVESHFIGILDAVVRHMNEAVRCFLRQDLYSSFPMEGYGDIIFSRQRECDYIGDRSHNGTAAPNQGAIALEWHSLQETLLEYGVACLVRPSPLRCEQLLRAEAAGAAAGKTPLVLHCRNGDALRPHGWLSSVTARETVSSEAVGTSALAAVPPEELGGYYQMECVVEDVIRGDVYVVRWIGASRCPLPLPPLIILDASTCFSSSTSLGFDAMRWAQRTVIGRRLRVVVHSVCPSDKDVANNTQLVDYEQLAHVRVSAILSDGAPPNAGSLLADTSRGSHSCSSSPDGGASIEPRDVGLMLLERSLCRVRRCMDAGAPRATNFRALCQKAAQLTLAATQPMENSAENSSMACDDASPTSFAGGAVSENVKDEKTLRWLATRWQLPLPWVSTLVDFSGAAWSSRFVSNAGLVLALKRSSRGEPGVTVASVVRTVTPDAGRSKENVTAEVTLGSPVQRCTLPETLHSCLSDGLTKHCWYRYLWCGDFRRDPSKEPRTMQSRPLRTLLPMESIASAQAHTLFGYVSGCCVTATDGQQLRRETDPIEAVVRLEVMLVNSLQRWRQCANSIGLATVAMQAIVLSPDPDEEVIHRGVVPLTITTVDMDGLPSTHCTMKVATRMFPFEEFARMKGTWRTDGTLEADFTEVKEAVHSVDLTFPGSVERPDAVYVYVVDVVSEVQGSADVTEQPQSDDEPTSDSGDSWDGEAETRTLHRRVAYYVCGAGWRAPPMQASNAPNKTSLASVQVGELDGEGVDLLDDGARETLLQMTSRLESEVTAVGNNMKEVERTTSAVQEKQALVEGQVETKETQADRTAFEAVGEDTQYFVCPVYFYFPISTATVQSFSACSQLLSSIAAFLYADVACLPVGIADINGVRGFLGDVVLSERDCRHGGCVNRVTGGYRDSCLWRVLNATHGDDDADKRKGDSSAMALREVQATVSRGLSDFHANTRDDLVQSESSARLRLLDTVVREHQWVLCQAAITLPSLRVPEGLQPRTMFEGDRTTASSVSSPRRETVENTTKGHRNIHYTAGASPLWRDAATLTPASVSRVRRSALPLTLPLLAVSLFPRQLFATHIKRQKKIAAALGDSHGEGNMDWSMMRLTFPSLPCLLREDLERLPRSLRNVERAFCQDILEGKVAPSLAGAARATGSHTGVVADGAPTVPLYAAESPCVGFLSLLFLLHEGTIASSRNGARGVGEKREGYLSDSHGEQHDSVYQILEERCEPLLPSLLSTPQRTEHVLYGIRKPSTPGGTGGEECLFLGSRDHHHKDRFDWHSRRGDTNSAVLRIRNERPWLDRSVVATLGFEALTEPNEARRSCGSSTVVTLLPFSMRRNIHRSLLHTGFPADDSVSRSEPILYHPSAEVAVLADPLVQHTELPPERIVAAWKAGEMPASRPSEDTSNESGDSAEAAGVTRLVGLRYSAIMMEKETRPYHLSSYGRFTSKDVEELRANMETHAESLKVYLSLALRVLPTDVARALRCRGVSSSSQPQTEQRLSAPLPDGLLFVLGTVVDPLYVHYRSRQDLRFSLGTNYPTLAAIQRDAQPGKESDICAAEINFVGKLLQGMRTAMYMISEKLKADAVRAGMDRQSVADRVLVRSFYRPEHAVNMRQGGGPSVAIKVYPVDEEAPLSETQASASQENDVVEDDGAHRKVAGVNPHQPFGLVGVVLQRLPRHELNVAYDADAERFTFEWNPQFEEQFEEQGSE